MFPLNARLHGVLDYAITLLLFALPFLIGLPEKSAGFFYVMALSLFVTSVITDYPFGPFKVIPFTTHGVLELLIGVWLIIAPWLYRFNDIIASEISLLLGIALTLMWIFTDHHETETSEYHMQMHEHHR